MCTPQCDTSTSDPLQGYYCIGHNCSNHLDCASNNCNEYTSLCSYECGIGSSYGGLCNGSDCTSNTDCYSQICSYGKCVDEIEDHTSPLWLIITLATCSFLFLFLIFLAVYLILRKKRNSRLT